jgi:NAD(P)-dependent dehydrogenase (short-subunit alcohol dehydrogenase family)
VSRLNGKVALVTGAARGIGEAIARTFVANGAFVYVTDIDDARGREVAATLGAASRYLRLDVREEADWQRATAQILAERGALDVVVNKRRPLSKAAEHHAQGVPRD